MGQGRALTGAGVSRRAWLGAAAAAPWLAGCGPAGPAVQGGFMGMDVERGHLLRQPSRRPPAPDVQRRVPVLVCGGGVAGLAALRALRQAGVEDVGLLELEDAPGGNSRGGVVGGVPCPLGAHYLPVPGDDAHEVQDLLEEFGVRRRVAGRWVYDERTLCHSPQERLFFRGEWREGLLPVDDVGERTLAQYRRFAQLIDDERRAGHYALPTLRAPLQPRQQALAARRLDAWLAAHGLDDPHLLWYLDYACRDDYGAGIADVSAWAGVHYFASRHGFFAPGDAPRDAGDAVLTWPQGNGWLTQRLAEPLQARQHTARTVVRIADGPHGVEVDAYDHGARRWERWNAARCIVALPLHVAARVVEAAPRFLQDAAARTPHAAWVVANLHLGSPLRDRAGAAPAWDNVLYGSAGLGYVDARHQALDPRPGPTVLTWYGALGASQPARQALLARPWAAWRDAIVAELSVPHPDLPERLTRLEVTRYGHAMAVPVPQAEPVRAPAVVTHGRLAFAHSDWSGYSVFEEAFTRGHLAGQALARAMHARR